VVTEASQRHTHTSTEGEVCLGKHYGEVVEALLIGGAQWPQVAVWVLESLSHYGDNGYIVLEEDADDNDTLTCERCGDSFPSDEGAGGFCDGCIDSGAIYCCSVCDEYIYRSTGVFTVYTRYNRSLYLDREVCRTCIGTIDTVECHHCDTLISIDEAPTTGTCPFCGVSLVEDEDEDESFDNEEEEDT
jgi:hypothetical protein